MKPRAGGGRRLAVCLYVRDEAPDIAEWLAFHHVVGVDHVLVLDNGSVDGTQAVVRRAGRFASVTLLPWPVRSPRAQKLAYAAGLVLLRDFEWVAFVDADELLTPTTEETVRPTLDRAGGAAAIAVNWAIFGSSGHADTARGRMLESYVRRAPDGFDENRIVKSIVRPRLARARNPHTFEVRGPYVGPDGSPVAWADDARTQGPADFSRLQVSHLFTRSRAHWARKMARGYRQHEDREGAFARYDRNEVEDHAAARFAPAVRAELIRRGQWRE